MVNVSNPRTQARNGLISYYKTNGVTYLKKHVDKNHVIVVKRFEQEVTHLMIRTNENQLA